MNNAFEEVLQDKMLVTGGHFVLTADGSTFKQAAELYFKGKQRKLTVSLGLLINDIGTVCSGSTFSIAEALSRRPFWLPVEYRSMMDELGILHRELTIFWKNT